MNNEITIHKFGGIRKDKSAINILENDLLLEEGREYLFIAYTQNDGSLLISRENSNIPLNRDNYNLERNKYTKAFENQIIRGKRYII